MIDGGPRAAISGFEGGSAPAALDRAPLSGRSVELPGADAAAHHAAALLESLGASVARSPDSCNRHAALDWARSGAMSLSGRPGGPPLLAPTPLGSCARGALTALRALGAALPAWLEGPELLGEKAAHQLSGRDPGLRGVVSAGGSCHLLRCADGWLALNLARADDARLLPAWLECAADPILAPERFAADGVRTRQVNELVERGRWMGLPVAASAPAATETPPPLRWRALGLPAAPAAPRAPRVVDLSALWAGPLATRLLHQAGAEVFKVECVRRPDAVRGGAPAFFDALHAGKHSVALDLRDRGGLSRLRSLVAAADLLVTSARPRALAQLGLEPQGLLRANPGLSLVAITGYGFEAPGADWVAFGDDASAAAGLTTAAADAEGPLFCGDAIADPLAGASAALGGIAAWQAGGGFLIDVSLRDSVASSFGAGDAVAGARALRAEGTWHVQVDGARERVAAPRALPCEGRARPLGADTAAALAALPARDSAC